MRLAYVVMLGVSLAFAQTPSSLPQSAPLSPSEEKALRDIEHGLSQLKRDVLESKLTLKRLQDAVLRGKLSAAKGFIEFQNQAEGLFRLQELSFILDGHPIYALTLKEAGQKISQPQRIYDDVLAPGEHELKVKLFYLGSDHPMFKAISDFKNEPFPVESTHRFTVDPGKTSRILVQALDKGYFKSSFRERIYVDVRVTQD